MGGRSRHRAQSQSSDLRQPRRWRRRAELQQQCGAFAEAVRPRARAVNHAGRRFKDALRHLAGARARTGGQREAAAARRAGGRRARVGLRLHRVPRSHRRRLDGHGAQRPRRRRQLSLDLRQPDVVQEIHRPAVQVQRAGGAAHRRGAAAADRRRSAAVRLRVVRQADPRLHRRDREAGNDGFSGQREEGRLRGDAIGG